MFTLALCKEDLDNLKMHSCGCKNDAILHTPQKDLWLISYSEREALCFVPENEIARERGEERVEGESESEREIERESERERER